MADHILIQVPISEKDLLKVCQENFRKMGSITGKVASIEGSTYAADRDPGKVKVTSGDTSANFLKDKLIAGSDIELVETTGTDGSKTLVANVNIYTSNSAPTNPTDGMPWLDLDEPFGTPFTIGDGAAGVDYELKFDGETNDGSLYWMEDEDYFKIVDSLLVDAAKVIYFRDVDVGINSANDGYLDLFADTGIRVTKAPRATTSLYRRYYHIPLGAANPGASGATWVVASANTTGGWRLTNATWLLRGQADIHADWDGATDLIVGVNFMVNVNNTGGADTDTVDLRINAYYKGIGDTATKTQAVEVPTVVGKSAQYKQFRATFTLDWDAASNVIEVGDIISIILNLETDTSEVDDIVVTSMEFYYQTAHLGIESGDI